MTFDPNGPTQPPVDTHVPFTEMAERIGKNAPEDFAGAFVIVTPDGKSKSTLLLDNSQSAAAFWGLLQSVAEIALAEINDAERLGNSYGRQR